MERDIVTLVVGGLDELAKRFQATARQVEGVKCEVHQCALQEAWDRIPELKPTLVILDLTENEEECLKLGLFITKDFPYTVLVFTASEQIKDSKLANLILKSVKTGARDFLTQPFNVQELAVLFTKMPELEKPAAQPKRKSQIISIFSNKGGVGTTTIASNVAVELANFHKYKVALVDLVLQHGDVAVFLDVHSTYTITNVIENIHRLDNALLMSALSKHASGLSVLPGPSQAEEADFISAEQIKQVVDLLKNNFDYIIVDAGHEFNDHVIAVLDISDYIIAVTSLDLPTIRNTKRALDIMTRLRYDRHKIRIVVSRYDAKGHLTVEDVQKNIGFPVMHCLANDYLTVISAINSGQPISKMAKKTRIAKGMEDLAHLIEQGLPAQHPQEKNAVSFLSNLMKK
jgi:pilus assembly protein CpaE